MEVMENKLGADPFPKYSLRRKLGNAETFWKEMENYYIHIRTFTDEDQAEIDRVAFEEFQTRYLDVNGRVEDALEDHRIEEETREQDRLKVLKVKQLSDRWEAAYQHIETVLEELKTRLEGEPIENVELLQVKSSQLEAIKEHISASAMVVDSMFAKDPEQTVVTIETQGTRKTQAETRINVCEELLAKFQAAINARNATNVEAAAPAVAEAMDAPAARRTIGPKFER